MENVCFNACFSQISTTALHKIPNGIVYLISKEALEDVLVVFDTALRCVFCWHHISTPRREKVYRANVEDDACIGVQGWVFFLV